MFCIFSRHLVLPGLALIACSVLFASQAPQPQVDDAHNDPALLIDLARVYFQHGLPDDGAVLLEKAQAKASPAQKLELATMLSHRLMQKQDFAGAVKILEPAIVSLPEGTSRARALMQLANLHLQNKANDAAEKALAEASKQPLDPQEAAYLSQAIQQQWLHAVASNPERLAQVTKDSEAALAANPKDEAALVRLREIYTSLAPNTEKAIAILERLAAIKADLETQTRLAYAYRQNKQYDKAIALYKTMMATQPQSQAGPSAAQVGHLLLLAGRKDEALAWMKAQFEKPGQTATDCNLLGGFYQTAQMPEAAEDMYAKCLPLASTPDAKAGIMLRIATSAMQRKAFDKADETLRAMETEFKDKSGIQAQIIAMRDRLQKDKADQPTQK